MHDGPRFVARAVFAGRNSLRTFLCLGLDALSPEPQPAKQQPPDGTGRDESGDRARTGVHQKVDHDLDCHSDQQRQRGAEQHGTMMDNCAHVGRLMGVPLARLVLAIAPRRSSTRPGCLLTLAELQCRSVLGAPVPFPAEPSSPDAARARDGAAG
jgi:hypothetical protein